MSPQYFSSETILNTFKSMRIQGDVKGKMNLERTTAAGVFLSLDMTQKSLGTSVIDLNPDVVEDNALTPRQLMTNKYIELFMPSSTVEDKSLVVREFGFIHVDGENGRNFLKLAFSSNFLTQPLKKASVAFSPRPYPGRPPYPLLTLGTGIGKWGAEKHIDWKPNFIKFFSNRDCGEDFFPLIVYLLRCRDTESYIAYDFPNGLRAALGEILTDELCDYLVLNSTAGEHDWSELGLMSSEMPNVDFRSLVEQVQITNEMDDRSHEGQIYETPKVYDMEEVEWPNPNDFADEPSFGIEIIRRALAALKCGSHIIFIGPPGTGKTTLAKQLAERCKGSIYQIHTATSDWTTHEVLGGYMPDLKRPERLTFSPGLVARSLMHNEWLIVDEINRADVDKAFGELFTFLANKDVVLTYNYQEYNEEGDPIGRTKRIVLRSESNTLYNPEEYLIVSKKPDWRMIGTMNTFDKAALYQLSYAFMRRFAFIEVPAPSPQELKKIIERVATLPATEETIETVDTARWAQIIEVLIRVFADGTTGLHAVGKPVGASIPIDIIKYLRNRVNIESSEDIDVRYLILEALEMYLFPQFEAQRKEHFVLTGKISEALELEEATDKNRLNMSLGSWTGALSMAGSV